MPHFSPSFSSSGSAGTKITTSDDNNNINSDIIIHKKSCCVLSSCQFGGSGLPAPPAGGRHVASAGPGHFNPDHDGLGEVLELQTAAV